MRTDIMLPTKVSRVERNVRVFIFILFHIHICVYPYWCWEQHKKQTGKHFGFARKVIHLRKTNKKGSRIHFLAIIFSHGHYWQISNTFQTHDFSDSKHFRVNLHERFSMEKRRILMRLSRMLQELFVRVARKNGKTKIAVYLYQIKTHPWSLLFCFITFTASNLNPKSQKDTKEEKWTTMWK